MRTAIALLAACITTVAGTTARADDAVEQEAVRHLNLGIAAYKLGHYDDALRELAETDRLAPDRANTHRWLALTYAKRGDCKSALAHVDGYMARVDGSDKRLPEIVELRDRCLGVATLVVESTPPGANIRIDGGAVAGLTPYRALGVRGGSHVVGVEKDGFTAVSRSITMPASGELRLDIDLRAADIAPRRRWWLWAGGAAVVIVAGVTAFALTRGNSEGTLPPIVCDGGSCK